MAKFVCYSRYLLTFCFCLPVPYYEKDINKQDRRVKVMCSSSPVWTPNLQLAAEQPWTGECWSPPKKKISQFQGQRRSPSKTVGGAKLHLESSLILTRDAWKTQAKSYAHQDPDVPATETEPDLPLIVWVSRAQVRVSVVCGGNRDWLWQTWITQRVAWASWRRSPLAPP